MAEAPVKHALDYSLVTLLLASSAGYALISLGPRAWRRRVLTAAGRLLARAPAYSRLESLAQRLTAAGAAAASCGGCESCESPKPETRIPIASVGRRLEDGALSRARDCTQPREGPAL